MPTHEPDIDKRNGSDGLIARLTVALVAAPILILLSAILFNLVASRTGEVVAAVATAAAMVVSVRAIVWWIALATTAREKYDDSPR